MSHYEHGEVAGFISILVKDGWEHAYVLDCQLSERWSCIEFFPNIDWQFGEAVAALWEDDNKALGDM